MTDIDFDELDRAVNSLMDQHNNQATPAPLPATPAEPVPLPVEGGTTTQAQSASTVSPAFSEPTAPVAADVTPEPDVAVEPVAPAPVVPPRRTGRFMDVVTAAPSARAATSRPAPSAQASRESAPLQPVAAGQAPQDLPVEPTTWGISADTSLDPTSEPAPDPEANAHSSMDTAPLDSPFIEGVEVNKRPLGGDNQPAELAQGGVQPADEVTTVADAALEPNLELQQNVSGPVSGDPWSSEAGKDAGRPPLPTRPELSPELLAVESASLEPESTPVTPAVPASQPVPAPAPVSPSSSIPGDINPQYSVAEAEAPEPSGIFEAVSESPQPLAHPEKKKSGWMVIVWILLLVVIGAGGGVAVWYFLLK